MSLTFNILTLFPEMFPGVLGHSLAGKALDRGDWGYNTINIRDFGQGVHKAVDDTPYGGGAGMVMRADIIEEALLSISSHCHPERSEGSQNKMSSLRQQGSGSTSKKIPASAGMTNGDGQPSVATLLQDDNVRKIYLSPRGKPLTQELVKELSATPEITLLCGRYEGVDQRVLDAHEFEEISIGDYVLSGGEPAALILMDACIRLLPGVMGNVDTADNESFGSGASGLLEYPHYTRPAEWTASNGEAYTVPEVLTSGDHAKIEKWRREQSEKITKERRPDLLTKK